MEEEEWCLLSDGGKVKETRDRMGMWHNYHTHPCAVKTLFIPMQSVIPNEVSQHVAF